MCGIDQGRELVPRLAVGIAVCRRGDLDDDAGRRDGRVLLFCDLDVPVAVQFVELDAPHERSDRSEEHTSELQSHSDLVCRLLLEKKKTQTWDRLRMPE